LGTSGSFSIIFYPYYGANNCDIGSKFCSAILESGLSFGFRGATATELGSIIKDHYSYIILGKPYLAMVPGSR
jgi:hypothetical protein